MEMTEDESATEIFKWYTIMSPGIQIIQMLTQGNRLTKTVNIFKKLIGIQLQDFFFTNKINQSFMADPLRLPSID